MSNAEPMDEYEAQSVKAHADFDRYYEDREDRRRARIARREIETAAEELEDELAELLSEPPEYRA